MKSKEEIKKWLLENCVNENGNLDLSELDFSDFEGNVFIYGMKVKHNLMQSSQQVGGDLNQSFQEVKRNLYQSNQKVKRELYQHNQIVGGELLQGEKEIKRFKNFKTIKRKIKVAKTKFWLKPTKGD